MDEQFEDFYRRTLPRMARLASAFIANPEDCADVVHDAYVGMFHPFRRLPAHEVDTYLRTVVANRCRRFLRRQSMRRTLLRASPVVTHTDGDYLLDAVRKLSASRRDVVLLRFYADCSEAEIARTLNIKPGTVKSRLHRALIELRTVLS
ncbi:MAG: polymerase ECF-type sigma factor [Actinomycetia bacterium]|nr:polymerase ECF-type sigma factor [Actinomycetes bacterium]